MSNEAAPINEEPTLEDAVSSPPVLFHDEAPVTELPEEVKLAVQEIRVHFKEEPINDDEAKTLRVRSARVGLLIACAAFVWGILTIIILSIRFIISQYLVKKKHSATSDIAEFTEFIRTGLLLILMIIPWGFAIGVLVVVKLAGLKKTEREAYEAVTRLLQYLLPIVGVIAVVQIVTTCVFDRYPITLIQVFWVTIVVVPLFQLAYIYEKNDPAQAISNDEIPLLTIRNVKNIVGHLLYQVVVLLVLVFWGHSIFGLEWGFWRRSDADYTQHLTMIFNTWFLANHFNAINARKLNGERNVFKGLISNYIFIILWWVLLLIQFLIVHLGWFGSTTLTFWQWLWCFILGAGALVWNQIIISV